ncbi:MAG: FCD domain-containing protein [Acetobacteraceae bacterium]|nr:FCD domain-containing protein [Acetobacteraceae bacterium]
MKGGPAEREVEYALLSVLLGSPSPVGSSAIASALSAAGRQLSRSTVGRCLQEFDARGLTQRVGNRGRRLTDRGRSYLEQLGREMLRARGSDRLLLALEGAEGERLIKVLVARRALEREAARLAALHATAEQLAEMERVVGQARERMASGASTVEEDHDFHDLVAAASGNEVLLRVLSLVRRESSLSESLGRIRREVGGELLKDHEALLECLRRRDPEAAEAAMCRHIDGLIDDVRTYWGRQGREERRP